MAQTITVFDETLDVADLKVEVTFVGKMMITVLSIRFSTGENEDDFDTLFATTVYTEASMVEFEEAISSSIRIGSERYREWLDSVGGVVLDPDADVDRSTVTVSA